MLPILLSLQMIMSIMIWSLGAGGVRHVDVGSVCEGLVGRQLDVGEILTGVDCS